MRACVRACVRLIKYAMPVLLATFLLATSHHKRLYTRCNQTTHCASSLLRLRRLRTSPARDLRHPGSPSLTSNHKQQGGDAREVGPRHGGQSQLPMTWTLLALLLRGE